MKSFLIVVTSFLLLSGEKALKSDIEKFWLNDTGEYIVKIYEENDIFKGEIVWLADSLNSFNESRRDVMNNDPELRSRLLKGLVVLDNFEYDDGVWRHGTVYNFKNGNDYNAHLKIDNDGNLRWTGYYGILFFLGKTKVWTKVTDTRPYALDLE